MQAGTDSGTDSGRQDFCSQPRADITLLQNLLSMQPSHGSSRFLALCALGEMSKQLRLSSKDVQGPRPEGQSERICQLWLMTWVRPSMVFSLESLNWDCLTLETEWLMNTKMLNNVQYQNFSQCGLASQRDLTKSLRPDQSCLCDSVIPLSPWALDQNSA